MLADGIDYAIGVDTHADRHTLVIVEAASGRVRCSLELAAERRGYCRALRFARRQAPGRRVWAVEGTGSYGAGLARQLSDEGECVCEVERPRRRRRRERLKDDLLDAERAARALLAGEAGAAPRSGGTRAALRTLLVSREAAVDVRRSGLNELRALLISAPAPVREPFSGLGRETLVGRCARLRCDRRAGIERYACTLALRSTARRVQLATAEAAALERELESLLRLHWPQLLAQAGIGPISAAQLVVSWSHRGRVRSEAAFARLAGVAPIPASSGRHVRHRLDRGGDRRLNRALHTIVLSRRRFDALTIVYLERRRGEGRSEREAVRMLKRYLARSLFRLLERMPLAT